MGFKFKNMEEAQWKMLARNRFSLDENEMVRGYQSGCDRRDSRSKREYVGLYHTANEAECFYVKSSFCSGKCHGWSLLNCICQYITNILVKEKTYSEKQRHLVNWRLELYKRRKWNSNISILLQNHLQTKWTYFCNKIEILPFHFRLLYNLNLQFKRWHCFSEYVLSFTF